MKDFTAIISSCKFGDLSVSDANKLINEQIKPQKPLPPADELWDEYSERVGTDIDELQRFAGTDMMEKRRFMRMFEVLNSNEDDE